MYVSLKPAHFEVSYASGSVLLTRCVCVQNFRNAVSWPSYYCMKSRTAPMMRDLPSLGFLVVGIHGCRQQSRYVSSIPFTFIHLQTSLHHLMGSNVLFISIFYIYILTYILFRSSESFQHQSILSKRKCLGNLQNFQNQSTMNFIVDFFNDHH